MNTETVTFVLTTVMVLVTMLNAYLGLRLYKKSQWLRLGLIVAPLLLNVLFYGLTRNVSFFYLGVILLLCIPFVWPRKSA